MLQRALRGLAPFVLLTLIAAPASAAPEQKVVAADAPDLPEVARALGRDEALRVEATTLEGFSSFAGLELRSFDVVAAGARFFIQSDAGARETLPDLPRYFRGSVDGMVNSVAVLSVRPTGEVRGVVSGMDGTWMLERKPGKAAKLESKKVEKEKLAKARDFSCEVLDNPQVRGPKAKDPKHAASAPVTAADSGTSASAGGDAAATARLPIEYTAQIAVELDYDYFLTFSPDTDAAFLYALDLMAFTGVIGEADLGMNVQVPFMQLWTTSRDPFSGGSARLTQIRERWNSASSPNCGGSACTGIARSTVILLSSAATGGVAFVPALCDSWHSPTNGYSYAYLGSIAGNFDIDSPNVVWDIVATAHELGHNFGSQHTHCYSPPVDGCFNEDGCYGGATSLPQGCPGSGQGCGTIMSYCHMRSGGMSNISLTYGAGHPYGNDPGRVSDEIISRVALEASQAPGCLTPESGMVSLEVSTDGTGSGRVTSSPAGIDCDTSCRDYFDADSVVTLTPLPNDFSSFAGWSGDADCSDGVVTLSAARSCVATFHGNCGVLDQDCDDGDPCTLDSCPGDLQCVNAGAPRDPSSCYTAGRTRIKLTDSADPSSDRLTWQWTAGEAFDQTALGTPSDDTDYKLCVYDTTAGSSRLATSLVIPGGAPHWRNLSPRGWSWSDGSATFDGIKKLLLKAGPAGSTKIKLAGVGAALPLPGAFGGGSYFDEDPSVTVQLVTSDDRCWTSSFTLPGTTANTPSAFKAAGN